MFLLRAVLNILVRNASPRGPMHFALWYVVPVCHQHDVCENSVGSVYAGGHGGLSESALCVFCIPSVLSQSAVMSYVNCGNYG